MANQGECSGSFFAEFYDILHTSLNDIDAYIGFTSEYGPSVLELGCGTGRLLIPLARAGFRVTGVDSSLDMLSECRRKLEHEAAEVAARIRLVKAEILELELSETFDLVLAPCNLLNYFTRHEDALALARRAHAHLSPGGTFIVDNSIPDIDHMVTINGAPQTYEFTHPVTGTTIVDTFTATYDFATQTETDLIVLQEYSGSELLRKAETRQVLTYYFPREARLLLEAAGFDVFREQGSVRDKTPITKDSGEMVFFCRKRVKPPGPT